MKKLSFQRIFSFLLAFAMVLSFVPVQTRAAGFDTVNFKGLVIEAESDVSISVFNNHGNDPANQLTPDYTETTDGITSYYFAGLSGACRCDAKRAGDYTIYKKMYMSPQEAATRTVERIVMQKRAGQWDHSYYYEHPEELMYTIEDDPNQRWKTEIQLDTPVFTVQEKAAQQMTTQPELEAYIQNLDDAGDNMYIFSIGTSSKYGFDIPIVFFTKTDLSGAKTLEEVAACLKANGKPNVSYKAQTHGDEPASSEGALAVMKRLDSAEYAHLLDSINIYVIPRLNPDGAYDCKRNLSVMIDPSLDNRDPDRDLMDMNSKEMRQYMYVADLFCPIVALDGHELGHSSDKGEIQLGIAWKPINGQALLDAQVDMMQTACENLKAMDLSGAWYSGDMNSFSSRNNRGFDTHLGRIHILMESRGIYWGTEAYGSRTASHLVAAMSFLEYAAENAEELNAIVTGERDRIVADGAVYNEEDIIILSTGASSHPEYTIKTQDYNTMSGSVAWVDQVPNMYDVILRSRVAPTAYVLPADLPKMDSILEQMDAQHIRYSKLPANAAVYLQQYYGTTTEAFLAEEEIVVFPQGAYVFTMDQPKGEILALLMEPDVTDLELYKNNLTFQEKIPQDQYGNFGSYRYIRDLQNGEIAYTIAPEAPEGLTATKATYGNKDGVINGLDSEKLYEYRKGDSREYTKLPTGTTEITGLTGDTYYVRYQAAGQTLCSADAVLDLASDRIVFVSTSGKDTNAGTEAAPVKTLTGAYGKLTEGGTIVFLDDLSLTGNTTFPVCKAPVTLTSKTGKEGIITTGTLRVQGNTTFENITVTFNATGLAFISGEGYDLTIGENVTTVNKTGNQVNLVATKRYDAALSANPTLTVKSGKWDYVYATHGNSVTGDITVNVLGGSFSSVSPSYNATVTGNVKIHIENAVVNKLYLEPTHKNGKVTGTYTVSLGDGVQINAAAGDAGVIQGGTTLELTGNVKNLGTMTGYGEGSSLILRSGTWLGTETGFGAVAVDIPAGKTLTLSAPITADTVVSAGTLDFNGVGSLNAGTVTGTVNCTITGRVLKNNLYASVPADADLRFPASYGLVNNNGQYLIYDLTNFEGLVLKAAKNVKITLYSDPLNNNTTYKARKDYVIAPYATEERDGFVYYYLPNITGLYCYEASLTGYYTVFRQIAMTAEEAAAYTLEEVTLEPRGENWELNYYFGQTDEILGAMEKPDDKWRTEVPLETPVFTNPDKAAHQMTTQPELEAFLRGLDDADDRMYIFSLGKSAKYGLDIPIVFFTNTDLSDCTDLEQVAEKLKASGRPNVGYKAQMHGDEHAAGEGALNVIRQLDQAENQYVLDSINLFVIPRMNPDGAYECQRNLRTPSIIDPDASSNTDPNRDMIVLNLTEQRYYLKAIQLLDPIAELDGHERNRNSNTGDIQIGTGWQWGNSEEMLAVQTELVQDIFTALEEVDLSGAWYNDFVNTDGIDQTRGFAGNQGRMQILIETRGIYLGNDCYGSRTASQVVSAMEFITFCAENAQRIRAIVEASQKAIVDNGALYNAEDTITLTWKLVADADYNVQTDFYDMMTGGRVDTQKAMFYVSNKTRVAPTAYVIPANLPKIGEILELMELQEIPYYFLPGNTSVSLQQYSGTVNTDRVASDVTLSPEQSYTFAAGAYVFQLNHVNAKTLAYMMEPDSPSEWDLVTQGRIAVNADGTFPIYRYVHDLADGCIAYNTNGASTLTTIYVSASGSDSATGAENAPVATLEKAYDLLTGALGGSKNMTGTIILLDNYTISSNARVDLPVHTFPVKILGKTAAVELIFKPTSLGESIQQLAFHGPTELDNLVLRGESTGKLDYIFACGNPVTIGKSVKTAAKSSLPVLVAGDYRQAVTDTNLTVLGGTWYGVYAGSFRAGHTGTAKLTVNGAKINNFIRSKYEGVTSGDTVLELQNTAFTKFNPGYTGAVSGDVTVILREGAVGVVNTHNQSTGSVTGTVTVVVDGADLSKVTFSNDSDTVDVLTFASGYATPVAGFSRTQIDTAGTVTLAADMTLDKISGGGTVNLNGYQLTGDGLYGMTAAVRSVSLRPSAAGLYYTGDFRVDAGLTGATYGIALSTVDETPAAESGSSSLYTTGATSVLVKDIMKTGNAANRTNATMGIYARAYIKLSDGTTIYSNTVKVTLRQVVTAIDSKWDALTAVQKAELKAMYDAFASDMASWNIPNLKKA